MKFKIGDRVRVTNALGTQKWAEGIEFTIDYFRADDSFDHSDGWYEGYNSTRDGEKFSAYDADDGFSGGIWEANLELALTLEEKLDAAKAEVASLEQQIKDRDNVDLGALPNGSVVSTNMFNYVKTSHGWYGISDVATGMDIGQSGPFEAEDFGPQIKLVRKGIE
jgi:hypothetical protein